MSESQDEKLNKALLNAFKVPKEMIRMEVEGLVGILHKPGRFVPKEKMWIREISLRNCSSERNKICANVNQEIKEQRFYN